MSALSTAIADAQVVVCCGTGGVGKTTTAAALGLQAATLGRRAVVATIDPAKRLADALGVPGGLGNDPVRLPIEAKGELWALMLDTARTFDGLVTANAANAEQAERILNNAFYRNVAGSFSGTQDYMAAERLHALHGDDRFDVVIVDTPPTRNALDFLDAPGVISRFLDHPLFKMMMLPTRRGLRMLNVATQPIMRSIGRVVGGDVLADAIAFFQAFDGMETGFRRRADEVLALLRSDVTTLRARRLTAGRHRRGGRVLRRALARRPTRRHRPRSSTARRRRSASCPSDARSVWPRRRCSTTSPSCTTRPPRSVATSSRCWRNWPSIPSRHRCGCPSLPATSTTSTACRRSAPCCSTDRRFAPWGRARGQPLASAPCTS